MTEVILAAVELTQIQKKVQNKNRVTQSGNLAGNFTSAMKRRTSYAERFKSTTGAEKGVDDFTG